MTDYNKGLITSYTNTAPHKRMLTDRILLADVYSIPTINALGLDNTGKFNFVNEPHRMYEWLEDAYVADSDTITSGLASDTTTTTFTPDTINLYQPGDVLLIDTEQLWVSANSGVYLTVTRGFGSTTAATHANSSTIKKVGMARIEGDDADDSPSTVIQTGYNYSTILQRTVNVSRTDQLIKKYGMSGTKEYLTDKYMDELMLILNKVPFYGKRAVGTSSAGRSSGGIDSFVTTNVTTASGAALTRNMIDNLLEDIWGYGGDPDKIFCNTWVKRKINEFYEGFVSTERSESMGGISIDRLQHPIGGRPIDIIVDRHCQTDRLYIIDSNNCGYITIDPFFYEDLAKTGDAEKGEVVGEYGFVLQFEKAHGYIHSLSTTT